LGRDTAELVADTARVSIRLRHRGPGRCRARAVEGAAGGTIIGQHARKDLHDRRNSNEAARRRADSGANVFADGAEGRAGEGHGFSERLERRSPPAQRQIDEPGGESFAGAEKPARSSFSSIAR